MIRPALTGPMILGTCFCGLEFDIVIVSLYIFFVVDISVLAMSSKDGLTKLISMHDRSRFHKYTLSGHTDPIVAVFFESSSLNLVTVGR